MRWRTCLVLLGRWEYRTVQRRKCVLARVAIVFSPPNHSSIRFLSVGLMA